MEAIMISILITSRVEGNVNHNLKRLLDSLHQFTSHPSEIEVLVKYDDDDPHAYKEANEIINARYPFRIACETGKRGRGYIDIHHGYNQLFKIVSPKSKIICAMADDFTVNARWDDAVYKAIEGAGDYFIIHQRPHPRAKWDDKLGILSPGEEAFCMSDDMFNAENLHIIDEAPLWSIKLLNKAKEALNAEGLVFPVSFTDAWTVCLEHVLWTGYGINITRFMPNIFINRFTCEVDQPEDTRWNTDRKENFSFINSPKFRGQVSAQAMEIAWHLSKETSQV